ncbi:MAG: flagellar biosynthesis protein FlhB [Alphaproteobacteria bacterium]|jgi:flagellar biosynthetic protein FlhB|nr:flagellar biosynthesis protein FlhB [Alphaproteobacteria bacterium]
MAEEQDQSQKTEEPTHHKLQEARKKGQVATSQEVKHWFVLLGVAIVVALFAPYAATRMAQGMGAYLTIMHTVPVEGPALLDFLTQALIDFAVILLLPLGTLVVMALAAGLIQNGLLFSTESLKPKIEKIDPVKGLKRLFSLRSLTEFIKGILKLLVVGTAAALVVIPELSGIEQYAGLHAGLLLEKIWLLAIKMLIVVIAIMAIIAGLDFMYQRYEFNKQQKMTKQEVKDEHKQTEGDPMVKSRLRQIRQERARQRMMAAVPQADVVVTNPTHVAVALQYDPDTMAAPKCVAKGIDFIALKIREIAEENEISIVENPPLARALNQAVDIDGEIPAEHYKAVAEIISYVFKLQGRGMPAPAG